MRSNPKNKFSLTPRKAIQIGVVLLVVLGVFGGLGYRWMQSSRYAKALRDAEDFLRLGDPRSAVFAAKRAARIREDSVPAARMLAEALERTGSMESVLWRKKVVTLAPGDWRDHIAFAAGAIRFRDPKLASSALAGVDATGRQHIDYHRTAADVALALGKNVEAEDALNEVLRLDPYDTERELKRAVLRLASPEQEKSTLAKARIEELKDDPRLRLIALRVLVREAMRANARPELRLALSSITPIAQSPLRNDPRLGEFASELLAEPEATMDDCLLALEVLRLMGDPGYQEKLPRLETAKHSGAADIGDALLWMNTRNLVLRGQDWVSKLPEELRTSPEVQLASADARMLTRDWPAAQALVEGKDWGDFEADRHVISAIVWRELDDSQRANASWGLAELRMQQDVNRLRRLAEFCARWGAEAEKEKLWWLLVACPGDHKVVLEKLFNLCLKRKDGDGLHRAVKAIYLKNPEDPAAMNNYAWLALLRGEDLPTAHTLADSVFAANPAIGPFVSTYAYSLHLRDRTPEAVKALEALPPSALRTPVVAGAYGYLLLATGQAEKGAEFISLARRSPDLLPEEARLFLEKKRETIDRSLDVPDLRIFSSDP